MVLFPGWENGWENYSKAYATDDKNIFYTSNNHRA